MVAYSISVSHSFIHSFSFLREEKMAYEADMKRHQELVARQELQERKAVEEALTRVVCQSGDAMAICRCPEFGGSLLFCFVLVFIFVLLCGV
jgi:hypothetical protein